MTFVSRSHEFTVANNFPEAPGSIVVYFISSPLGWGQKICKIGFHLLTEMAAMLVWGKNPSEIFSKRWLTCLYILGRHYKNTPFWEQWNRNFINHLHRRQKVLGIKGPAQDHNGSHFFFFFFCQITLKLNK